MEKIIVSFIQLFNIEKWNLKIENFLNTIFVSSNLTSYLNTSPWHKSLVLEIYQGLGFQGQGQSQGLRDQGQGLGLRVQGQGQGLENRSSRTGRDRETRTALLKVTLDALIAADQGKLTLLGMLDLSATFDCVDHGILLDRLETSFEFSGVVLDWMRSYLVGRGQYVRHNGSTSSATVMQCGVPQGSVLIPLYFVLYTADAFRIVGDLGLFVHG